MQADKKFSRSKYHGNKLKCKENAKDVVIVLTHPKIVVACHVKKMCLIPWIALL